MSIVMDFPNDLKRTIDPRHEFGLSFFRKSFLPKMDPNKITLLENDLLFLPVCLLLGSKSVTTESMSKYP